MELTNMPKVVPHSWGGKWQISVEFDVDKWCGGLAPIYCFFPVDIEHYGIGRIAAYPLARLQCIVRVSDIYLLSGVRCHRVQGLAIPADILYIVTYQMPIIDASQSSWY